MLDSMASAAELNVEETKSPPVLVKLAKIPVNRFTVPMPDGKLEEKLQKLKISESCNAIMDPLLNDEIIHLRHQTNDGKSYVSFAFTVCFVSGVSTENACHEHSHSTSVFWGRTESNTHTKIEDRADCHSPCIIHNAGFEALRPNQYTLETACYSHGQNYGQYP